MTMQTGTTHSRKPSHLRQPDISRQNSDPMQEPAFMGLDFGLDHQFYFWSGASGQRYVHTIYTLIGCPPLPKANIVMVRRQADGSRVALHIANTVGEALTLNLAAIRQRAAQLGANEIHVHLLGETDRARDLIARDLQVGQFAEVGCEPRHSAPAGMHLC